MNALLDGITFIMLNAQVGIEVGVFGWSYF
jgi:hypothetical protein